MGLFTNKLLRGFIKPKKYDIVLSFIVRGKTMSSMGVQVEAFGKKEARKKAFNHCMNILQVKVDKCNVIK